MQRAVSIGFILIPQAHTSAVSLAVLRDRDHLPGLRGIGDSLNRGFECGRRLLDLLLDPANIRRQPAYLCAIGGCLFVLGVFRLNAGRR
jgi:hypothetical protein